MAHLNTTIPAVTMEQLRWLAQGERYGTQSAAIQAALRDLYETTRAEDAVTRGEGETRNE